MPIEKTSKNCIDRRGIAKCKNRLDQNIGRVGFNTKMGREGESRVEKWFREKNICIEMYSSILRRMEVYGC